jgi:hypothetical protein
MIFRIRLTNKQIQRAKDDFAQITASVHRTIDRILAENQREVSQIMAEREKKK